MGFLTDTNVVSELARRDPNAGVLRWLSRVSTMTVSAITVEELACGLAHRPNARVQSAIEWILENRCDVEPVTAVIARRAGRLRGVLLARGDDRAQADMLIAATAELGGHTLVTRNETDFEGLGISVLNPFD
jgi:predicted nucleic acid-binding protein